jgi:prepilin-type N-terminal cleavage/methylation domain-containing protein
MTTRTEKSVLRAAFTLVELLTVMAIIALLIGLLVPALGHVKTTAKIVQQKAQLKSIETALEAFNGMYGDYPPSNETRADDSTGYDATDSITCGAQKMTEAVLGVDLRGYDPRATSYGTPAIRTNFDRLAIQNDRYVYAVEGMPAAAAAAPADVTESLNRRKGPYVTVNENVGSFEVLDLYGSGNTGLVYAGGAPGRNSSGAAAKLFGNVMCDVFKVKSITYSSYDFSTSTPVTLTAKVGTPILYYKANPNSKKLNADSDVTIEESIYNWHDNMHLVALGRLTDKTKPHWWMDTITPNPARNSVVGTPGDAAAFYSYIQNPKIGATRWPYNPDSFILISAGPDGIYGNSDDITNFGTSEAK